MIMKKTISDKVALRGLLVATAFVLSWIELQVPYFFAIPGMKLGLTNLAVLTALYMLGPVDAFAINMLRILLVSLTFGNMSMLAYSAAGGLLSYLVMLLLKSFTKSGMRLVSVTGAISHNVGQILVAIIVLKNIRVIWYLPFLWISGIAAGILIGLLCEYVTKRITLKG